MDQEFLKPKQMEPKLAKPKFAFGTVRIPHIPPATGPEEVRWARVKDHLKKMEQENKRRFKKRRLVCYSCWTKDGGCCCNLHEVDADHPLMNEGGGHHWFSQGGDGKCNSIPDAVCITSNGCVRK